MYDSDALRMHRRGRIFAPPASKGWVRNRSSPHGDEKVGGGVRGDSPPQGGTIVVASARRASRRSIASSISFVTSARGGTPEASHIFGYIEPAGNPGIVFTSL